MEALKYIKEPWRIVASERLGRISHIFTDEFYLKCRYRTILGKKLDLKSPKTFNEKIQWLKLHDRKKIYTTMVDKYEAKKYVAKIIGEEHIIPTIGVWDRFDDIDISQLPNQFVLKCTHDSGGLVICRDKEQFNIESARNKIEKCMKNNYYWMGREWPYKDVKPRIIAEIYMEDNMSTKLRDYKTHTFNGVTKALFLSADYQAKREETKVDFKDMDYKYLPSTNVYPNADTIPVKIESFNEIRRITEMLSDIIPQLKIDLYEVNGKAYFGELTYTQRNGFFPFNPVFQDGSIGSWIQLPESYGGGYGLLDKEYILWLHEEKQPGLIDYKFFCFNAIPELLYVSRGLEYHPTAEISFYDLKGNEMDFYRKDYKPFHNATMPDKLNDMIDIAGVIARNINNPFVRVDLYYINGSIFFSEITFSPNSGMIPFEPEDADLTLGSMIKI